MTIDYERFVRVCSRCVEVAADAKLPAIIGIVYKTTAEAQITTYLDAAKAVASAESAFAKENKEAIVALDALDGPYKLARSTVVAVMAETRLPDTLRSQPTDTDKLNAITGLLDIVDEHVGQPWADALLQSDFGTRAPATVKEIEQAIAANKLLSRARVARAAAYGPAHDAYIPYKRVVRDALGPASKEYRRIHLRASPTSPARDGEASAGNEGTEQKPTPEQAPPAETNQITATLPASPPEQPAAPAAQ